MPALSAPRELLDGHNIGTPQWPTGSTAAGGNGASVAGLGCGGANRTEDYAYHVHAHLSIFLDGKQLAIPAAIGIKIRLF